MNGPTQLHLTELNLGDRTLDDFRSALCSAVYKATELPGASDTRWVRDVFDTHLVLSVTGTDDMYEVEWEENDDGEFEFTLGDKVKPGYVAAESTNDPDVLAEQTIDQKRSMGKAMFAYAPGDDPADWKLPLGPPGASKPDRKYAGQAVAAAFAPGGFRGRKAKIPASAKGAVRRKLQAAYRKLGVPPEDWPEHLGESIEEGETLQEATIVETFPTVFEILERDAQGRAVRVKGSSGVVDLENKNGRTYPRELIEGDLPRIAEQAAAGKFIGEVDHPGDGQARLRNTGLKYEKFSLTDTGQLEYIASVVPTDAGRDFAALVESGVAVEMSWRGRGRTKREEFNGEETILVQPGYKLLGIDAVVEGSAPGTSVQITEGKQVPGDKDKDKDKAEGTETEATEASNKDSPKPETAGKDKPVITETPKPEASEEDAKVKAIAEKAAQETVAAMWPSLKVPKIEAAVAAMIEKNKNLGLFKPALIEALGKAENDKDFAQRVPLVEAAYVDMVGSISAEKFRSIGIVQGEERLAESYMTVPDPEKNGAFKVVARPRTIQGVKAALLDGLDNGLGLTLPPELEEAAKAGQLSPDLLAQCRVFDNPAWIFGRVLENYERDPKCRRMLTSMTEEGFRLHKQLLEVTDASDFVAGTPYVLPILRDIFPVILDVGLWSTQPMDRPTGTAYWLHMLTDPGGVNLATTAQSGITVYEESEYPNEIQLGIDHADITAITRALRWQWKVTTEQDISAYFGISTQGELMTAARNAILRDIFWYMIQTIMGAATGGNYNHGVLTPAAGGYTQQEWDRELMHAIDYHSSGIATTSLRKPNIVVLGIQDSWRFHPNMPAAGWVANPTPGDYDFGVTLVGTLNGWYRVLVVDWWDQFYPRQFLLGYNGSTWLENSAVYLPYIPWYMTSIIEDTNFTKDQAGMSRFGAYVTRPGMYGTITLQNVAGTALTW